MTSYLRYCGHDVQTKDTFLIFSSALFGESITFLSSGFLHRTLSCRQLALVGGLLLAISTLLTSFMTTLFSYTITYGVLFGMSIGISYTAPISICFSWLPDHKGLVSGVILAGFGGGAILFNILASYVVVRHIYIFLQIEYPCIIFKYNIFLSCHVLISNNNYITNWLCTFLFWCGLREKIFISLVFEKFFGIFVDYYMLSI